MQQAESVYLDSAATTPVDPRVVEAMTRIWLEDFGNPSSRHPLGLAAERHLRQARATIAARVQVEPEQLTFTGGGTEAIALALLGTARLQREPGHVLISAIEHAATRNTALLLEAMGHTVEKVLPVPGHRASGGFVEPEQVAGRLRDDTFLVALMHVNNETGIEQPVARLGRLLAAHERCRFFVDAVQSFTKLPVSLGAIGADLLAISAHKIHGPKGVGCLVRRKGLRLEPLWGGGDQEAGLRPGTENVAGIVGFGRAVELGQPDAATLRAAVDRLVEAVCQAHPHAFVVGDPQRRAPHIAAVALPRLRAEVVVNALAAAGVYTSTGSACHARNSLRSEVTRAMGLGHGVIRLSVSQMTTDAQVERAVSTIRATLAGL